MIPSAPSVGTAAASDGPDGVSVVVCCYNSVDRLPPTIAHLARQRVPDGVAWEVVVADDASTDATAATAAASWQEHGVDVPFRVVAQPEPGLSAARAKGLEVATHGIRIFCDDDNWLAKDYVARAFEAMRSNASAAVLGGRGAPALAADPPAWFAHYATYYALGPQAEATGDVTEAKGYVYGAGLVLRRSAWDELCAHGFRSQLTGRKGASLASSEDRELCYALRLRGHRIRYEDGLQFMHEIPDRRLAWSYLLTMVEMAHRTTPVMEAYALALSGERAAPEVASRRTWWKRCARLVSKVVRKPTIVVGALRARGLDGCRAVAPHRRCVAGLDRDRASLRRGRGRGHCAPRRRDSELMACLDHADHEAKGSGSFCTGRVRSGR